MRLPRSCWMPYFTKLLDLRRVLRLRRSFWIQAHTIREAFTSFSLLSRACHTLEILKHGYSAKNSVQSCRVTRRAGLYSLSIQLFVGARVQARWHIRYLLYGTPPTKEDKQSLEELLRKQEESLQKLIDGLPKTKED